jgi:hypothetical protein
MESLIAEFNLPRRLLSICISTNPVGTTDQPSHIDYSGITSSLFIPLTPVVTQNTIAYFEPELSDADKQRIIGCTSGEEIYATLAAIQQEISADMREIRSAYKPFSVVYLPAATVHRAVGNNSGFDRKMVCVMLTDDENYQMDEGEMEQGNY